MHYHIVLTEDLLHCLYLCPKAWDVWKSWKPDFTINASSRDLKCRWLSVLKQDGIKVLSKEVVNAWAVWKSKNECIFKQVASSPFISLERALSFVLNPKDHVITTAKLPSQSDAQRHVFIGNHLNQYII